jgi:hypothetical protein
MTTETCQNCRFWVQDCQMDKLNPANFGHCRRYPPTLFAAEYAHEKGKVDDLLYHSCRWPVTNRNERCGEHEPKPKPPEPEIRDLSAISEGQA